MPNTPYKPQNISWWMVTRALMGEWAVKLPILLGAGYAGLGAAGLVPQGSVVGSLLGLSAFVLAGTLMLSPRTWDKLIMDIYEDMTHFFPRADRRRVRALNPDLDNDSKQILIEVEGLHQSYRQELKAPTEDWILPLLDDLLVHVESLREHALKLAETKARLVKVLSRTNIRALEGEVQHLRTRIGRDQGSPLISALRSTQQEIASLRKLQEHNKRLYAQMNNIKSALRQAHLDLVNIKLGMSLGRTQATSVEELAKELKEKLNVVEKVSREVIAGV